jgi:hypothetical protein
MINDIIFELNYFRNSFDENDKSMIDLKSDNQDYSLKNMNDELLYIDQPNEIKNQNIIDLWEDEKDDNSVNQIQDKTTAFKTINKTNKKCYNTPLKLLENIKIEEDNSPILYSFNDIEKKILRNDDYKNKFSSDVDSMFIKIEKLESKFLNKKRHSDDNESNFLNEFMENEKNKSNEQKNYKKRGRKPINKEGIKEHDRMAADNIIKKIKTEFFKYMILFINNIISTINLIYNHKIYKMDYELINRLNREIDLKYLNTTLKDLLSLNVSPKFTKVEPESNKNYIEKILNEKSIDETIKFVLNMTFRDFIKIFSYKKKIRELLIEYKVNDYNIEDIYNKIEKNLIGVDDLFNKLAKSDKIDKYYFSNFVFYLYNYEKWFFMKRGRKKKNINIEI